MHKDSFDASRNTFESFFLKPKITAEMIFHCAEINFLKIEFRYITCFACDLKFQLAQYLITNQIEACDYCLRVPAPSHVKQIPMGLGKNYTNPVY